MATGDPLTPLVAGLRDLFELFKAESIPAVLIGGAAVSLLGRPRATRDIDALVLLDEANLEKFLKIAERAGFAPRLRDAVEFAKQSRVLLLRHSASEIDVDLSLGILRFELETVARRSSIETHGLELPVPSVEDLIIMKVIAGRPRDLSDVEGLVHAHKSLDAQRIQSWMVGFAEFFEGGEPPSEFRKILSGISKRRR